jgi:glycosyltransferase 2 family protein
MKWKWARRRHGFTLLIWLVVPLALWLALRQVDWAAAWQALARLRLWQVGALALINLAIVLLLSSRWWLILRGQGFRVPFLALCGYRLAAFPVSYFTPGAQFGGEPLQVYFLHRRHGLSSASALASVTLDKLFEILVNLGFLALGLLWLLDRGLPGTRLMEAWAENSARSSILLVGLLGSVLLAYLAVLRAGHFPLRRLSTWVSAAAGTRPLIVRIGVLLSTSERHLAGLLRQNPGLILGLSLLSGLIWVLIVFEYWLTLQFLGLNFDLFQTIAALTAARLAFLTPLPGGAGVLEAGQSFALQALGASAALGISLSLVIRARDFLFAAVGLALLAVFSHAPRSLALSADQSVVFEGGIGDESNAVSD